MKMDHDEPISPAKDEVEDDDDEHLDGPSHNPSAPSDEVTPLNQRLRLIFICQLLFFIVCEISMLELTHFAKSIEQRIYNTHQIA